MAIKLLGTRGKKENEAGNRGITAVFLICLGDREHQNRKKIFLGNKGTQGKFCWGTWTPPPPPPPSPPWQVLWTCITRPTYPRAEFAGTAFKFRYRKENSPAALFRALSFGSHSEWTEWTEYGLLGLVGRIRVRLGNFWREIQRGVPRRLPVFWLEDLVVLR